MTLPAHRYLERKKKDGKDGKDKQRTVVVDFDETVTKAPDHIGYVLGALRAQGCRVVILTGNDSDDLTKRLDDYGIPYDDLIQYKDTDSSGIVRAEYLEQLDAWLGIDNRIDRAPTYVKVCPHLFLIAKPTGEAKDDAKGGKKAAKKDAKAIRMEHRGPPRIPPNYRPADMAGQACGTCDMNNAGECWGYGNVRIESDHVCDSWEVQEADQDEQSPLGG